MEENEFKLTYYIGPMLAQGGVLTIHEDRLVFAPGTLERALGAHDTAIPFAEILLVDVSGVITESLIIKTQEKIHRFVGGNPHAIKDRINASIQKAARQTQTAVYAEPAMQTVRSNPAQSIPVVSAKETRSGTCPTCAKATSPEFSFCPFCKTLLAKSCSRCFKKVESQWKYCAFCGNLL